MLKHTGTTIETIHRARISYETDSVVEDEAIMNAAMNGWGELDVMHFAGVPAAGPYFEAESDDEELVTQWVTEMEDLIKGAARAEVI